ncbi:MAG: beta-ketoacyl-[acyl-carrier-protein] synthase family protein, partial [Planctomycetes bacterium]|nr:beta-ketoacyl-[acyl-carrier-protein] synthase family protein [Planctomycetota bacterium]
MNTELVVTGAGLITGLARGVEANWARLLAGESGFSELTHYPLEADVPARSGAWAGGSDEDPRERAHGLLVEACLEALGQAGLEVAPDPERSALILGSSLAAQASAPRFWRSLIERGAAEAELDALQSYDVEARLADLSERFDLRGEAALVSNACAAGASALGLAADAIRLGRVDFALVAGFDALDLHTFAGFNSIQALAAGDVLPFSTGREGMKLGDGFAALILERAEVARAAGRAPLARLAGYGESADAHHLTQPHPEGAGAVLAMQRALRMAELAPEQVDAVNVHATATPANDLAEFRALRAVFGERAHALPLVALKPALGHTLGGAGAVEAVITLGLLRHQQLVPTAALGPLDPEIERADRIPSARPAALRCAMSNAFGFGGCNASLIFTTPERPSGAAGGSPARALSSAPALTGLGIACPLGVGAETFWAAFLDPQASALEPAPKVREGLAQRPAVCFAKDFPAERYTDRRAVRKAAEVARLAAAAGQLALDAAALPEALRDETCVVLGTTLGCSRYYLDFHEKLQRRGLKGANAVLFTESVFNASSAHLSRIHGLRGAAHTLAGGEDVGLAALAAAHDRIKLGAPAALAGGTEQFADLVHASLLLEGRVGTALGLGEAPVAFAEGAAAVVLE